MRSRRPYLLRAMYEWMVDCDHTPYVLVDARQDGVVVPPGSIHEGRIVLNIGPSATQRLRLGDDALEFDARFGGVSHHVVAPVRAVLAIYARETGEGMMFGLEDDAQVEAPAERDGERPEGPDGPASPDASGGPRKGRPALKVVK